MTKEEAEKVVDHIRQIIPVNAEFLFSFRTAGSPLMECFLFSPCPGCYVEETYKAVEENGLMEHASNCPESIDLEAMGLTQILNGKKES